MHAIISSAKHATGAVVEPMSTPLTDDAFSYCVKTTTHYRIRIGFGVYFFPVYAGEDEPNPDAIVAVDTGIVRIEADTVSVVGGVPCVKIRDNLFQPVENFGDANHVRAWVDCVYIDNEADAARYLTEAERQFRMRGWRVNE